MITFSVYRGQYRVHLNSVIFISTASKGDPTVEARGSSALFTFSVKTWCISCIIIVPKQQRFQVRHFYSYPGPQNNKFYSEYRLLGRVFPHVIKRVAWVVNLATTMAHRSELCAEKKDDLLVHSTPDMNLGSSHEPENCPDSPISVTREAVSSEI